jgi:hypothetical protein
MLHHLPAPSGATHVIVAGAAVVLLVHNLGLRVLV